MDSALKVLALLVRWAACVALVKLSAFFIVPTCIAGYLLGHEFAHAMGRGK